MASTTYTPGPSIRVDDDAPLEDHESIFALGATHDGGYVVVWLETASLGTTTPQLSMQRFDAAGNKVGGEVHIARPAPNALATVLSDGSVLLSWTASQPLQAADPSIVRAGVYTQRIDPSGAAAGPVTEVHALVQDMRLLSQVRFFVSHEVNVLADGSYVVGWTTSLGAMNRWSSGDGQAQRFEADGARRGGILDVGHSDTTWIDFMPGASGDTFITMLLASGGPAATSRYLRVDGATLTALPADTDGTVPAGSQLLPLADGRYLLWTAPHLSAPDPMVRFLGTDGLPVGPALVGIHLPAPAIALADGGFLTLRTQYQGGVTAQRFDAQGNPVGTALDVGGGAAISWSVLVDQLADGSLALGLQSASHVRASDVTTRVLDAIEAPPPPTPAPTPAPEPAPAPPPPGGTGAGGSTSGSTAPGLIIFGTSGADTFAGTSGSDVIQGGGGLDVALYAQPFDRYDIARTAQGVQVTGPDGTDLLLDVERIRFADQNVALDVQGSAGKAFRLYQAAFDRRPDMAGLGYQMNALDKGLDLAQVASHFIASPEFQARYGNVDNAAFVRLLYANVLDRAPDAAGLAYHVGTLAAGTHARANVLVGFSESPENQAALIGVVSDGMPYLL